MPTLSFILFFFSPLQMMAEPQSRPKRIFPPQTSSAVCGSVSSSRTWAGDSASRKLTRATFAGLPYKWQLGLHVVDASQERSSAFPPAFRLNSICGGQHLERVQLKTNENNSTRKQGYLGGGANASSLIRLPFSPSSTVSSVNLQKATRFVRPSERKGTCLYF